MVLGIIALFICTVITPSVAVDTVKKPSIPIYNGKTLYVGGSGPGNYTTIRGAINNANNGDTVFVYNDSSPYSCNIVIEKSISLVGEDKNTTIINGWGNFGVVYIPADKVTVRGFTIRGGAVGITLQSNNNIITDNIITSKYMYGGIMLKHCNNNTITGNNITFALYSHYNSYWGINLFYSRNNVITGNTILNTSWRGIDLYESFSNTITDNIIINNDYGIILEYSFRNIIKGNNIKGSKCGIYLEDSARNIIKGNNIKSNVYSIKLFGHFVYGNFILKNNFLGNGKDAYYITFWAFRTNRWRQNYWNESRIFPKPIFGERIVGVEEYYYNYICIPWFPLIDWRPAQEPYDIGV